MYHIQLKAQVCVVFFCFVFFCLVRVVFCLVVILLFWAFFCLYFNFSGFFFPHLFWFFCCFFIFYPPTPPHPDLLWLSCDFGYFNLVWNMLRIFLANLVFFKTLRQSMEIFRSIEQCIGCFSGSECRIVGQIVQSALAIARLSKWLSLDSNMFFQ